MLACCLRYQARLGLGLLGSRSPRSAVDAARCNAATFNIPNIPRANWCIAGLGRCAHLDTVHKHCRCINRAGSSRRCCCSIRRTGASCARARSSPSTKRAPGHVSARLTTQCCHRAPRGVACVACLTFNVLICSGTGMGPETVPELQYPAHTTVVVQAYLVSEQSFTRRVMSLRRPARLLLRVPGSECPPVQSAVTPTVGLLRAAAQPPAQQAAAADSRSTLSPCAPSEPAGTPGRCCPRCSLCRHHYLYGSIGFGLATCTAVASQAWLSKQALSQRART